MLKLFKKGANINRNRLDFCQRQVWFCRPVGREKAGQTNGLVTSQISIVDFHPHLCWDLECRRLCRVLENRVVDSPLWLRDSQLLRGLFLSFFFLESSFSFTMEIWICFFTGNFVFLEKVAESSHWPVEREKRENLKLDHVESFRRSPSKFHQWIRYKKTDNPM